MLNDDITLTPALEARGVYSILYQRQGLRKASQLVNPRITDVSKFDLPRAAIYHYINPAPVVGPPLNEPLLSETTRPIYMYHVTDLVQKTGAVIPKNIALDTLIQDYHMKHRRFKRSLIIKTGLRDVQAPFVINYPKLLEKYKYQESAKGRFYQWYDYLATIVDAVKKVSQEANDPYQQFIVMDIPSIIPKLSVLKAYENNPNPTNQQLALFSSLEALLFLDIYLWLGKTETRQRSLLSRLSEKDLNQLNILLTHQGKSTLINLGKLDGYRRKPNESRGMEPVMMQLLWVKLNLTLARKDTPIDDDELNEKEDTVEQEATVISTDLQEGAKEPRTGDIIPTEGVDEGKDKIAPKDEIEAINDDLLKQQQTTSVPIKDDEIDDGITSDEDLEKLVDNSDIDSKAQQALADSIEKEMALLEESAKLTEVQEVKANGVRRLYDEPVNPENIDYTIPVARMLDEMITDGRVGLKQAHRIMEQANSYRHIPAPGGNGETIEQFISTSLKDTDITADINKPIAPTDTLIDKDMAASTLNTFDKKYIEEVLPRDIVSMATAIQNTGISVLSMDRVEEASVEGEKYTYTMRISPLEGPPSTVKFTIPKLSPEGTYLSNGTTYSIRKQKFDIPIRKVSPTRVALSSYYGKVFVERSEKRVSNYPKWLANQIRAASLSKEDTRIQETRTGNVYDNHINTPYLYSCLSQEFRTIMNDKGYIFYFDYHKRFAKLGEAGQRVEEATGMTLCGKTKDNHLLFIDKDDTVYSFNPAIKVINDGIKTAMPSLGHIAEVLGFDSKGAPLETASLLIGGKEMPLGIVIAYSTGLTELLNRLATSYRKVSNLKEDGTRAKHTLNKDEYIIRFLDYSLIFSRKDRYATLLLSGFHTYREAIKDYPLELFDRKDVYYNVLEANKLTVRHIRELQLQYELFIDPITLKILNQLALPTTYRGLLFKANEMLLSNGHPDETDASQQRIRGYERIAGSVYIELVKAIRLMKARGFGSNYGVAVNPQAVYMNIMTDPAKEIVKELNPIGRLKEREAITYSGNGGRSSDTMVRRTRAYHVKDMGIISEAGVDNANVGINMFTSANPRFTNLYGLSSPIDPNDKDALKPTQLLSTTSLLNVGSMNDDSKRVGFGSIMRNHIVPTYGNSILPLRTGYEQIIARRVGKTFAHTAAKGGKVTAMDETSITVTYDDGTNEVFTLGRRYGSSGGLTVPLDMQSNVKVGQSVEEGDVLAYNPSHFAPDPLDSKVISMKDGVIAKVALLESNFTLEDSNAVSRNFSKKMGMEVTKKVPVFVKFDNEIHRLVKVGQKVTLDDLLCIIEDPITSTNSMFDEESIMMLQSLGAMTPKAKKNGVVERIEVFYNGDKEDMSESLRAIADAADRRLIKETRTATRKGYTGLVGNSFRYEARPVEEDSALLVFYITGHEDFGGGDKCLFGNQMKSTVGAVLEESPMTESGVEIDALFGVRSIYARIVLSPMLIGTTTSLLKALGKHIADKYLPNDK